MRQLLELPQVIHGSLRVLVKMASHGQQLPHKGPSWAILTNRTKKLQRSAGMVEFRVEGASVVDQTGTSTCGSGACIHDCTQHPSFLASPSLRHTAVLHTCLNRQGIHEKEHTSSIFLKLHFFLPLPFQHILLRKTSSI